MKLPSVKSLLQESWITFKRFHSTIIIAVVGTIVSFYVIGFDYKEIEDKKYLINIIHTCILGIPLFISIILFCERIKFKIIVNIIIRFIAVALLIGYYIYLPKEILQIHIIRSILIWLGLYFLVVFAPFIGKNELNGFWQFNKSLFLRGFVTFLYSLVLLGGLSLAMGSIDILFGVDIKAEWYWRLYVLIGGIFSVWFFLAGLPKNYEELQLSESYPKGLKIFSQYILVPLITIYLVILYVYAIKIIIEWEWPIGWVSSLIISASCTGILALLMVYPVQNINANKWIKTYFKLFYWALLPLVVLLFLAIWRRISEYGVTENRYFILVFAFWLAGISIFLLINKLRNIKIIPITLCIIALLSSFGPWGTFNISLKSQMSRLENLLTKNNILINGKVRQLADKEIPFKDNQDICSIVEYVCNVHGEQILQPLFKENFDSIFIDSLYLNKPTKIIELIGIEYISRWQKEEYYQKYFYYSAYTYDEKISLDIKDYDYYLNYNGSYYTYPDNVRIDTAFTKTYSINEGDLKISYSTRDVNLTFSLNDTINLSYDLKSFINNIHKRYPVDTYKIPPDSLTIDAEINKLKLKICFSRLDGNFIKTKTNGETRIKINEIQANVFIGFKKEGKLKTELTETP